MKYVLVILFILSAILIFVGVLKIVNYEKIYKANCKKRLRRRRYSVKNKNKSR